MTNIDRALNIYQSYSLAKISALNKKSLAMQYAQCGEINNLEKNISRELQAVNKLNRQILENQLRDIKHQETIKFYRKIAFDAKEAIEIINSQDNIMFKCFICEIYAKPLGLLLEDAKNNLEEITDKEYCSVWIKKLESINKKLQSLRSDFLQSSYYIVLSKKDSYEKEKENIEEKRKKNENALKELIPEKLIPLRQINEAKRMGVGCMILSIILLILCLIVFFVNLISTSDVISLSIVWIVFPIILIVLSLLILKRDRKQYPIKLEKINKDNEDIKKQNEEIQKGFDCRLKAISDEAKRLNNELNVMESEHPYSVALTHINKENPQWQSIIEKIENSLPKENEKIQEKEFDDPLYEEIKNYVIMRGVASISNIQRKFTLGYKRAGKIMDKLEEDGIIGPSCGEKARIVLISS